MNIPAWMAPSDKDALRSLLMKKAPISVMAIGVFAGSSTQIISTIPSVKKITCIDIFDTRFISDRALHELGLDRSFDPKEVFLNFVDNELRDDIHLKVFSEVLTEKTFLEHHDLIFLDADRSSEWLIRVIPHLLKHCEILSGAHFNSDYARELVEVVSTLCPSVQVIEKTNIWYVDTNQT